MDDKHVKAILCVRGGYGISRIVDDLNFKKFIKHPKWIIGFSDVTVLHAHILANYKIATLHSPMAAAFNDEGFLNPYVESLRQALVGEPTIYHCEAHELNREGVSKGVLVGGNLTLLAHLIGTPSDLNTKHKILFLEDVGEYLYSIDRLFVQLKRAGKFDRLEGLIIGGFTDTKDTVRPFGKTIDELIYEQVKEYEFPVCFGFPVSHAVENYALKVGVEYELTINPDVVSLKE
jgi:muramoyltetrapeptide carboxypeptidase